jgi:hypothetical protein
MLKKNHYKDKNKVKEDRLWKKANSIKYLIISPTKDKDRWVKRHLSSKVKVCKKTTYKINTNK